MAIQLNRAQEMARRLLEERAIGTIEPALHNNEVHLKLRFTAGEIRYVEAMIDDYSQYRDSDLLKVLPRVAKEAMSRTHPAEPGDWNFPKYLFATVENCPPETVEEAIRGGVPSENIAFAQGVHGVWVAATSGDGSGLLLIKKELEPWGKYE